ncbi:Nicotinamide-nucleotide amidohydrolase PncC [Planctomycetes bacterium Poly30]|uniref:CinA-like protein n=1 Tax=Saltatorellus ferox TaxID=2528018 RepID=A0A518EWQ7_9BACT|nr:Nicotinamide-nucleotide amidohydrolase PncC [Planctomycetes bacterium Poly30]
MSPKPGESLDPSSVGIVAVGDELLAGAHPDLNSPYLAYRCLEFGRTVRRVIVVGDEEADIAAAVDALARETATVFVSGGLGPTLDDVTRHGVAKALGVELYESEEAWAEVSGWFLRAGRPVLESNRRQALIPVGSERIPNAFGTAPGFRAVHPSGAVVMVGPGPPKELQGVFDSEMAPWLAAHPPDSKKRAKRTLHFGDLPESTFADGVGVWMARDANPLVGVTVKEGVLTARCVATADTETEANRLAEESAAAILALFPDRYLGEEVEGLGSFVGGFLAEKGLSFTVAESCTGGLVAGALTDAPGVSAVFQGSYVTYANERKVEVLGVAQASLDAHGAVSQQVAAEMARGALERSGARLAVSTTGVAGPTGGTEEKPIGLVWFGLALRHASGEIEVRTVDRRWPPLGRERIRSWAKNKALGLLLEGARDLTA